MDALALPIKEPNLDLQAWLESTYISLKDANVNNYRHVDVFVGAGGRGAYWARISSQPAATIMSTQVAIPSGSARDIYVNVASGVISATQDFPVLTVLPNSCLTSALSAYSEFGVFGDTTVQLMASSGGSFAVTDLSASIKTSTRLGSSSANSPLAQNSTIHYRITTSTGNEGPVRLPSVLACSVTPP